MISYPAPAYFLSDSHLPLIVRPGQKSWTKRVVAFLRTEARKSASLFLVGDLFDFWFEWRHSIPGAAFPVLAELYHLAAEGRRVVFIAGNHDGHPGAFLEEKVGITVSRAPINVDIEGSLFHINHGDGIAPADWGYRILRGVIRLGPTESIYRLIHPDIGIWLAHQVSRLSINLASHKDTFGAEPYRSFARDKLNEGFDYVVMGHRHSTDQFTHANGGYLAIGDWIRDGSYGVFDGKELKIRYFAG